MPNPHRYPELWESAGILAPVFSANNWKWFIYEIDFPATPKYRVPSREDIYDRMVSQYEYMARYNEEGSISAGRITTRLYRYIGEPAVISTYLNLAEGYLD